jgi:hypothetical protein
MLQVFSESWIKVHGRRKTPHIEKVCNGLVWWITPVIPATPEVEVGDVVCGWPEHK